MLLCQAGWFFPRLVHGAETADYGHWRGGGKAECTSILSLVAIGDACIEAAKQNGRITKVSHVDWEAKNVLGIIDTYRCIVYGQR